MVTRRSMVATALVSAAARKVMAAKEWKPRLGALGPFTEANVEFVRQEGFNSMVLGATPRTPLDATAVTDALVDKVKTTVQKAGIKVSALQVSQNHIEPDPARRARANDYFVKAIELAGRLGVPYVGTASGKDADKPFPKQVDEIVRVYNEKYFPVCQKHNVRILWEPYPLGANIATSPVG